MGESPAPILETPKGVDQLSRVHQPWASPLTELGQTDWALKRLWTVTSGRAVQINYCFLPSLSSPNADGEPSGPRKRNRAAKSALARVGFTQQQKKQKASWINDPFIFHKERVSGLKPFAEVK